MESGPCPGMILTSSGTMVRTLAMLAVSPSTLPPLSMSTKGKRAAKKSSPMCSTLEPVNQMTLSPSVWPFGKWMTLISSPFQWIEIDWA